MSAVSKNWACKTCGHDVRDGTFYGGSGKNPPEHVTCRAVAEATSELRAENETLRAAVRNLLAAVQKCPVQKLDCFDGLAIQLAVELVGMPAALAPGNTPEEK